MDHLAWCIVVVVSESEPGYEREEGFREKGWVSAMVVRMDRHPAFQYGSGPSGPRIRSSKMKDWAKFLGSRPVH